MIEHPATTLLAIWLLQMAYLGALQLAGLPFGFAVWPMGEDRNWLRFMQDGPGLSMMHEFWTVNDRNPLSPWWYWLFRWPIYHTDYGLYVVRKLVDPFLAITVALLVKRLFRGAAGPLPLLLGLLVLICNFTNYREQITWNFLVAFGLALLAAHWYLSYVDGTSAFSKQFEASLLLFFCAIATYTLAIGIVLVIAAVALFRVHPGAASTKWSQWRSRFVELACFAGIAGVFLAIWYTVSRPTSSYYELDLALVPKNVLSSALQLLWHPDFTYWIGASINDHTALLTAAPMIILLTVIIAFALWRSADFWGPTSSMLSWTLILLLGIGTPIIVLESTSDVWFPGSRTRMIYQVSAPLIAAFVIMSAGVIGNKLRWKRAWQFCAGIGFPVAVALLIPASFEYNKQLTERTALQRQFARELERLADKRDDIRSFFVRFDTNPAALWGSDELSDTYAKTMIRGRDVSMRLIPREPRPSNWTWWRLLVGPDDKGVRNATSSSRDWLPYRSLLFVQWDGTRLSIPSTVNENWFNGLQVDWNRASPIVQRGPPKPECPATFDFSEPPSKGIGWSVPERVPGGGHAMWMSSQHASMRIRTACRGRVEFHLSVAGYMAEDIFTGLSLRVDRYPVRLVATRAPDGRLSLAGVANVAPGGDALTIEFDAPRTLVPSGGSRNLAVMFSEISVSELASPPIGSSK